jgi:hypothetical protein
MGILGVVVFIFFIFLFFIVVISGDTYVLVPVLSFCLFL